MKRFLTLLLFFCCMFANAVCKESGDIYVVSVGVANYQNISDLVLPEKDAIAIANLYKTQTKNVILITGKYATKVRILKSLEQQFSRAKEEDIIVFFFSGHGSPYGICPFDMKAKGDSGVSYQEIRNVLKKSCAKRKIIFADACFSGKLRKNVYYNHHNHNDADILFFLSSRGGETSIESPFMVNGFFTTYLLRGLRGGADADRNRKITAEEIFTFVSKEVKERSNNQQHPVMWGRFNDDCVLMDWN